jgi:hypothetical protein
MKKIATLGLVLLAAILGCNKKPTNTSPTAGNPSSGTMTTTDSKTSNASIGTRDLSGTWIANEGPRVWELVITKVDANTFETTPTLVSNSEKDGLIDYGPPGSKGDAMIIITDGPGRFRVRWAKAENFHGASFWEGTGTYDDNSFNFAGHYTGKRKS